MLKMSLFLKKRVFDSESLIQNYQDISDYCELIKLFYLLGDKSIPNEQFLSLLSAFYLCAIDEAFCIELIGSRALPKTISLPHQVYVNKSWYKLDFNVYIKDYIDPSTLKSIEDLIALIESQELIVMSVTLSKDTSPKIIVLKNVLESKNHIYQAQSISLKDLLSNEMGLGIYKSWVLSLFQKKLTKEKLQHDLAIIVSETKKELEKLIASLSQRKGQLSNELDEASKLLASLDDIIYPRS